MARGHAGLNGTMVMTISNADVAKPKAKSALSAWLAFVVGITLAGCDRAPSAISPQPAKSERSEKTSQAFAIEAEFSAKDTVAAEKDRRILRWADSPCGMSPVVKTDSVLLNDAVLQPDFVVEFAADGRALRT